MTEHNIEIIDKFPKRKHTRLKEYDYSLPGMYFVTLFTAHKLHLFGKIKNEQMILNELGKIVDNEISKIHSHYKNIAVHKYVIMPNHIHMIIDISDTEGINPFPTKNMISQM